LPEKNWGWEKKRMLSRAVGKFKSIQQRSSLLERGKLLGLDRSISTERKESQIAGRKPFIVSERPSWPSIRKALYLEETEGKRFPKRRGCNRIIEKEKRGPFSNDEEINRPKELSGKVAPRSKNRRKRGG